MSARSLPFAALVSFALLVVFGSGARTLRSADPTSEKVLVEENFDDALGKDWSWHHEVQDHWKVDKERKQLVMRATRGWMEVLNNVPLRDAPDIKKGPFAVEVHVSHVPMGDYEFAGLMWHFDDKNFVVVRKGPHGNDGKSVSLLRIKDGKGEWIKSVAFKDPDADLRLVVTETKAQGWYRASIADKWQMIGEVEMPGKGAAKVGFRTGNGEGGSARFSKFRILQLDGR